VISLPPSFTDQDHFIIHLGVFDLIQFDHSLVHAHPTDDGGLLAVKEDFIPISAAVSIRISQRKSADDFSFIGHIFMSITDPVTGGKDLDIGQSGLPCQGSLERIWELDLRGWGQALDGDPWTGHIVISARSGEAGSGVSQMDIWRLNPLPLQYLWRILEDLLLSGGRFGVDFNPGGVGRLWFHVEFLILQTTFVIRLNQLKNFPKICFLGLRYLDGIQGIPDISLLTN
jgi:hypothetical protein